MQKNTEALDLFNNINSVPERSRNFYHSYKVRIYTALDQPDQVIAAYKEYSKYKKSVRFSLASYLQKIKRTDEALKVYIEIFSDKSTSNAHNALAVYNATKLLDAARDYRRALILTRKLESLPGCNKYYLASAKLIAAKILAKQGKTRKAQYACRIAKKRFESIISSSKSSKHEINRALDGWTECDISLIDKSYDHKFKIKEGSFTLTTNLPNNENLKITYIVPVDPEGNPLPSANNVVFHAPYAGERTPLNDPHRRYFSENMGFTSFSFNMHLDLRLIGDDKQKFYIFNESGWHDIVFTAQQKLLKDFNLKPSKLLVVGQSSGGSMAQLLAINHPDKIDAVAGTGGRSYNPVKNGSKVAWLVLNTWGCANTLSAKQFKRQSQTTGVQVLRGETPSILKLKGGTHAHHTAGPLAWKLMEEFIRGVVELREKNNGIMPIPKEWPIEETINNEKQFLPSERFAFLWEKLPHKGTAIFADKNDNSHIVVMPSSRHARAIVLFVHDQSFYESTNPMDNLYFLAKQNNIAIGVKVNDDHFETLKRIRKALSTILRKQSWRRLPIYVAGSGNGGRLAAVAALSIGSSRIRRITTFNSEYRWPFRVLSTIAYRRKSWIPLIMFADSKEHLTKTKNHRNKPVLIKSNRTKFGKWWFYLLAQATKE